MKKTYLRPNRKKSVSRRSERRLNESESNSRSKSKSLWLTSLRKKRELLQPIRKGLTRRKPPRRRKKEKNGNGKSWFAGSRYLSSGT